MRQQCNALSGTPSCLMPRFEAFDEYDQHDCPQLMMQRSSTHSTRCDRFNKEQPAPNSIRDALFGKKQPTSTKIVLSLMSAQFHRVTRATHSHPFKDYCSSVQSHHPTASPPLPSAASPQVSYPAPQSWLSPRGETLHSVVGAG